MKCCTPSRDTAIHSFNIKKYIIMRKYIAFAVLLFISGAGSLLHAQSEVTDTIVKGKIEFEESIHDFGQIKHGGDGTFEFIYKNTGTIPVSLSNVRSSCGCTIPTWPKEPLLPGKSEVIKVKYDTKRTGAFSKTITVYANAEGSPFRLQIKGTVNPLSN